MASIFTYDPDPPRVSSPWAQPEESGDVRSKQASQTTPTKSTQLSDYGMTKLQPEPQDGPMEYKLHLLCRKRRAFTSMSTAGKSSIYQHQVRTNSQAPTPIPDATPRQQRLRQLTTQLLWRLQQSSPYHASSNKELIVPRLLNDSNAIDEPVKLEPLIPGLEESRGALYEIGVADDGTLNGLTSDEMDESIWNLRKMAASLGCSVQVTVMVVVGDCEWMEALEIVNGETIENEVKRSGKLWVAEALVLPDLGMRDVNGSADADADETADRKFQKAKNGNPAVPSHGNSDTPQLRVTLTGPTTSGKSTLLGTLSTGTLDNGRGKSRLSLLKHRHEVVSGVTSSIAQEIIGYKDHSIMNFSQVNIESWDNIHDRSQDGRLVFVSDSGGHPRYRRTVLRGLMNWAPHWSILCIAADDGEVSSSVTDGGPASSDSGGDVGAGVDLVNAHLTLSLKLEVPLAVVITKLDLANKASLHKTVSKVLTAIKASKRTPKIIQPDQKQHDQLKQIPEEDCAKIRSVVDSIIAAEQVTDIVPIILLSAVKGTGIGLLHALLESLPVPSTPTSGDFVGMALNPEQPQSLFHIDDKFGLDVSHVNLAKERAKNEDVSFSDHGVVVSGYLRFGDVSVGDRIVVGPFPVEEEDLRGEAPMDRPSPGNYGLSISHPSSTELSRFAMKNAVSASTTEGEWHHALVVSVRNLRLPVTKLLAGQAGSLGLVFENPNGPASGDLTASFPMPRVRRGMIAAIPSKHMVDTGLKLQAASGFTATFTDPAAESLTVGSFVNVYVASVRATARIVTISRVADADAPSDEHGEDDIFLLNEELDNVEAQAIPQAPFGREVFLELLHSREWIEMGAKLIVSEGGPSGLEGIVGKVTEIVD